MSSGKGKPSGWAAFHLELRRKMSLELEASTESFPPLSSSVSKNIQNVAPLEMPFRSVLQKNSVNFPSRKNHVNSMRTAELVSEYKCERDHNNDVQKHKIHKSNNSEFNHECNTDMEILLNSVKCPIIEPECKEDDVYLIHREEAVKNTRSAARHSKAAKNAYLRGNHLSAQQYSQKSREERMVAKRLNEKAAKEILSIKNSKNDQWTLDLHGLYSAEAVTALQEHLSKIESPVPIDKSRTVSCGPSLSANCREIEKSGIRPKSSKPTSLQVITGRGNHSRGEPALPSAVRSFLIGNGYHFDETLPGVVSVRPKFRQ